jgi:phosphoribosylformylglycinamidine cyclo-ligase
MMEHGRFDLAGFCVGVVEEDAVLDPSTVREGDALVGLASSGLHSNGYSLVRHALLDSGKYGLGDTVEGLSRPLVDELLEPTAIYAPLLVELVRGRLVKAAAHTTGGGLEENVPRALPDGLGAELDTGAWDEPPIFELLQRAANLSEDEMRSTFNLGLGMVLVAASGDADEVIDRAEKAGTRAWRVGHVVAGSGVRFTVG